MMIEKLIEKMILEGKIKREELDELIEREQAKNPVPALVRENADMAFNMMVLEDSTQTAIQDIADLNFNLMMNGVI